jgi:hypothetical protein
MAMAMARPISGIRYPTHCHVGQLPEGKRLEARQELGIRSGAISGLDCTLEGPDQGRPISKWVASGATRVAGRKWPDRLMNMTGYVIMPAGRFGPAFIATDNYYAIKNYNESDLYVLFVGNLADRIAGGGKFITPWRDVDTFTRPAMQQVQRKLVGLGYNVGDTIDGLIGFRTRTATGMHQRKLGLLRSTAGRTSRLLRS